MRVPNARSENLAPISPADLPRPPEHKTKWVAYALHISGGCLIGLHRIYLGKPDIVPYLVGWFAITMFMMIANAAIGIYLLHGLLIFLYADLLFIPGMVKRKNAALDAEYEQRVAQM